MKRSLNKISLLFISFAAIFGSGWLFAPFYAAQEAGAASLLAWLLGAIMSLVIGLTMAEVITLFPKTGGLNTVAALTHGELLGFLVIFFNLFVFIILPVIEVRAIVQYLSSYFISLVTPNGDISWLGYLFSFILLTLITLVNLYGAKLMALLTSISVIFKIATPILLCSVFLYVVYSLPPSAHSPFDSFFPIHWKNIFKAIATSGIIFSFNGFNQATVFAGEAKNPQKTIPFAIFGALLFSCSLYLLVQYVFLISVPPDYLTQGWKQLSFEGDQGPFAGLAILLGLGWLLGIIYADAVISPLGTAFTYASAAPRMFYALAEGNQVFPQLMTLNRYGIPFFSVALTLALELIAFVLLPGLRAMISILVAAFILCYTTAPASLLKLRQTQPHLTRAFRVPWAPLFCYLSLFFSNLMVFSCGWIALRNLILTAMVLGILYLLCLPRSAARLYQQSKGSEWFLIQLFGIGLLSYCDHLEFVPFGISLCGVAILSAAVLPLSLRVKL